MGQWTIGLLYGVPCPAGIQWHGDSEEVDGEWTYKDGVAERCFAAFAAEIAALEKSGKLHVYERAANRFVPALETEQGADLLGFWIAAGASGKPGCPSLNRPTPIAKIRTVYRVAYKNARVRWRRFARWAREQGIEVGKARIYLTQTEVS